ncbi:MAG: ATP-binding cassette domain-containing protein [Arcobacter butzleri]|jgi:phospholipid/cholesterol/gamma-HCH transport system ATP-binding protein|nr:ATP-binding cassette domain-containing protein [Arcobacteraceae bacterium]MDY0365838.1 ATP-binding cassette domain-containing protein [Arcobacteraceae bacterium]NLO17510.1 ATP-binding cassette domain-containing protein [Aliarcobacter butzleri]
MIIEVKDVVTKFGDNVVHDKVNLTINEGEIYGLLGGSGSGKTTLLREMILLQKIDSGKITVLGKDIINLTIKEEEELRTQWGVLFQFGALYSTLNVLENIMIPLREYTSLPDYFIKELALLKLKMVGLPAHSAYLYPSELSGGMKKRAGLARALILDPKILFLDEPTSGLDPASSREFDRLILKLQETLGMTIVMVTHDKDSIKNVLDRFTILQDQKVVFEGDIELLEKTNPKLLQKFTE